MSEEQIRAAHVAGEPRVHDAPIYLAEYGRGNLARAISFSVDLIAGLPSIAIGVFVWAWLVRNVVGQYNGLAGGVALAIIMIPILTRTVEETLRIVPDPLREASLALGIPRWKTILRVVLPTAQAGVITGVVLSLARAGGETAPLLLTALGNQFFNLDLLQPTAALPIQIYNYAVAPYEDWHTKAWGSALVLISVIGLLSLLLRNKEIGSRVVPIIPDEARTFGMDALFREIGIYSPKGQLYEPHQVAAGADWADDCRAHPIASSSIVTRATSNAIRYTPTAILLPRRSVAR